MNGDDLKSRAQALRVADSTPKQIARTLGITRARALSLIHSPSSPQPDRTPPRVCRHAVRRADRPYIGLAA
jgi:hypothetical protein